jgi:hypothetical protein
MAAFMPFPSRESNQDGANVFWFQKTSRPGCRMVTKLLKNATIKNAGQGPGNRRR